MNPHEISLREMIVKAIEASREPDPHVIARRLLPKVPAEMREELVFAGLHDHVRKQVQLNRAGSLTRREGVSKWQIHQRVSVAGEWKLLASCGLEDLRALAGQHRVLVEQNLARAAEYEALAARLEASGLATVADLWAVDGEVLAA